MLNAHNTVFSSKQSAISNSWFLGPTRVLNANSISIASAVFAGLTRWQTDQPTDHATWSVTIGGIYTRRCGLIIIVTCRLLDWFPCFYRRTEQGNRIQQTSLCPQCGIVCWTIYFLNLSPVNAKLTLLSYIRASANHQATENRCKCAKNDLCRGYCRHYTKVSWN